LIPNDQPLRRIGHWCLVICWSLGLDHWSFCLVLVICWSLGLGHWSFCLADTVTVGSGGSALPYPNVKITRVDADALYYELSSGERKQDISRVVRVEAEGEPALNAAEEALLAEKYDQAIDGYTRALR